MGLAFTVRYTAIYYPVVATIAIFTSQIPKFEKIAWVIAPVFLFIPFINFTRLQTKIVTGTAEFSVFGGWQIANNALYMYGHIRVDSTQLPTETRRLDRMVKQYFKWAPPGYINLNDFEGTFFIKHSDAPLKQYMLLHYYKELQVKEFLAWVKVSPLYNQYGTWLVSHYPLAFARHYLWLNARNYLSPYLAQQGLYNLGEDSVWGYAQTWFHYPSPRVHSISRQFQGAVLFSYPPIFFLLNLYYAICLVWLWINRKFHEFDPTFKKSLLLLTGFWIINCCFSIFATPVVLRYELVPMLFLFTFSLFLLEFTDFTILRSKPHPISNE